MDLFLKSLCLETAMEIFNFSKCVTMPIVNYCHTRKNEMLVNFNVKMCHEASTERGNEAYQKKGK